jgi:hypothetical protein
LQASGNAPPAPKTAAFSESCPKKTGMSLTSFSPVRMAVLVLIGMAMAMLIG